MKKPKEKDKKLTRKRKQKATRRKTRLKKGQHNYQIKHIITKKPAQIARGEIKLSLWQRIINWLKSI